MDVRTYNWGILRDNKHLDILYSKLSFPWMLYSENCFNLLLGTDVNAHRQSICAFFWCVCQMGKVGTTILSNLLLVDTLWVQEVSFEGNNFSTWEVSLFATGNMTNPLSTYGWSPCDGDPFSKVWLYLLSAWIRGGKFYKVSFIWLRIDIVNSFPSYSKITNVANGVNFNKTFLFFPVLNLHY